MDICGPDRGHCRALAQQVGETVNLAILSDRVPALASAVRQAADEASRRLGWLAR